MADMKKVYDDHTIINLYLSKISVIFTVNEWIMSFGQAID